VPLGDSRVKHPSKD
jgi:hypothetical protein